MRKLLDFFDESPEDKRKNKNEDLTVDKEKLCDLLSEVEAMLAVGEQLDALRSTTGRGNRSLRPAYHSEIVDPDKSSPEASPAASCSGSGERCQSASRFLPFAAAIILNTFL